MNVFVVDTLSGYQKNCRQCLLRHPNRDSDAKTTDSMDDADEADEIEDDSHDEGKQKRSEDVKQDDQDDDGYGEKWIGMEKTDSLLQPLLLSILSSKKWKRILSKKKTISFVRVILCHVFFLQLPFLRRVSSSTLFFGSETRPKDNTKGYVILTKSQKSVTYLDLTL